MDVKTLLIMSIFVSIFCDADVFDGEDGGVNVTDQFGLSPHFDPNESKYVTPFNSLIGQQVICLRLYLFVQPVVYLGLYLFVTVFLL